MTKNDNQKQTGENEQGENDNQSLKNENDSRKNDNQKQQEANDTIQITEREVSKATVSRITIGETRGIKERKMDSEMADRIIKFSGAMRRNGRDAVKNALKRRKSD